MKNYKNQLFLTFIFSITACSSSMEETQFLKPFKTNTKLTKSNKDESDSQESLTPPEKRARGKTPSSLPDLILPLQLVTQDLEDVCQLQIQHENSLIVHKEGFLVARSDLLENLPQIFVIFNNQAYSTQLVGETVEEFEEEKFALLKINKKQEIIFINPEPKENEKYSLLGFPIDKINFSELSSYKLLDAFSEFNSWEDLSDALKTAFENESINDREAQGFFFEEDSGLLKVKNVLSPKVLRVLSKGDVLLEVNQTSLDSSQKLIDAFSEKSEDNTLTIKVERKSKENDTKKCDLTL